jgi:hypothetical protein
LLSQAQRMDAISMRVVTPPLRRASDTYIMTLSG